MLKNVKTISLCLVLVAFIGISCSKKNDTEQIRNMIGKQATLAQEHKIDDLLKFVTEDFTALPGNYDAESIKGILSVTFQYYGDFTIYYPIPSVDVAEDAQSATAKIYYVIVNQDKPVPGLKELYDDPQQWVEAAGEKADLYQLNLDLVKVDGDWRVKKAQTEGFRGWNY